MAKKFLPLLLLLAICSCTSIERADTIGESGHRAEDSESTTVEAPAEAPKAAFEAEPLAEPTARSSDESSPSSDTLRGAAIESELADPEFMMESAALDSADGGSGGVAGEAPAPRLRTATAGPVPSSSGLKAGFADDNRQYGYFVGFLEEFVDVPHYELSVAERIVIQVQDENNRPVANAVVSILSEGQEVVSGKTTADGSYQFNPSGYPASGPGYRAVARSAIQAGGQAGGDASIDFDRFGERNLVAKLDAQRAILDTVPLDILFVLDTTGSMGEEIHRLRATIELIYLNLTSMSSRPDVRFGMVLYKDIGDEYDTRVVPLTGDLEEFRRALNLVEASGGGDTPENLQAALERALREIEWNPTGVRLGFVITDAPPHLDYGQEYTYAHASRDARAAGIKLFSVGTGGLPLAGEYVLRQIAQYTGGKYIFLTYGESGESEGGVIGSVSHHTGANYQTGKLEAIIIRFAKEELSHLSDDPLAGDDPYFEATRIDGEEREETLEKLFRMAVDQLSDFSTFAIGADTVAAVLPIEAASDQTLLDAEYFTEQMLLSLADSEEFTLIERQNVQDIIDELKFQLSGLTDSTQVVEIGNLLNAEVLITGKLYVPGDYELFLRLLRVENGEVLSVTKAVIDRELGIGVR
jgi:Mg-chelatase subunit ChlD